MPKLLWVAAPLALALLVLVWLAWRGRAPSRLGLNVAFSLLLLGYVVGTAGLGIFWVANQQLPVFDWHYLFGYTTVLLLVVHLAFNWRVVWQLLRRKDAGTGLAAQSAGTAAAPRTPPTGRRPLLGFVGVGGLTLAAGAGYLLGLRHGRTELRLVDAGAAAGERPGEPPGQSPASSDRAAHPSTPPASTTAARSDTTRFTARSTAQAAAVVEQFHAFSAHSRSGVLRRAASTDWGLAPPPFKRYPAAQRLPLPQPPLPARAAAGTAPAAPAQAPDLRTLGAWLWLSAGISQRRGGIDFRTSPSSGALFATELYLLALDVRGLESGLWHYDPETHALDRLPQPGGATPLAAFGPLALLDGCHALVVACAIFARSGHKYGDRTYRYVTADLGHLLENLRVAARAEGGVACRLLPAFDDPAIGRALGLDERREGVLAVAALGGRIGADAGAQAAASRDAPAAASPASAAGALPMAAPGPSAWSSPVADAFAAESGRLGVTDAMQLATSLRAPPAAGLAPPAPTAPGDRSTATPAAPQTKPEAPRADVPGTPLQPLLSGRALQADWPQVIARRRSVRRFAATPVPRQALADILQAMTAPAPMLSGAVRIDLLSAAAEGLEPASWRHDPARHALVRRVVHGQALRARARAAALDQDVIGDAAVVFVLSLDRQALRADPLGPARAYRHGFIEAGLVGERLYLAAGALGLAVCAVGAFYDDEAAALLGLDPAREWVVHFAALGVPG
jgi:SagB-type dehydrogenase family enzyme